MKKLIVLVLLASISIIVYPQKLLRPSGKSMDLQLDEGSKGKEAKPVFASIFNNQSFSNPMFGDSFWGELKNSRNALITFSKDSTASLLTEFLVDSKGLWRFAFLGAVTTSNKDSLGDIQNFFETGGNAIVNVTRPLFFYASGDQPKYNNVGAYFDSKVGATLPKLGSYTNSWTYNIDIGLEIHTNLTTDNKFFNFFMIVRAALATGSDDFLAVWAGKDKKVFGYGKGSVGVILKDLLRINVNFPIHLWGKIDPIDQAPITLSTGLVF